MKPLKYARFDALTGLRAVAAIMVFCFHFRKFWWTRLPLPVNRMLNEFHVGVSIFFVLSGFLIVYTYKDTPLDSPKAYLKYMLIRLVRIFPVYLVLLTLKYGSGNAPSSKEMLLNYTLLKGFSDKFNLTGIPQSWSLTVEMTFYFLAPFLYMLGKGKQWKPLLFLLSLLLVVLLAGFMMHRAGLNKDDFFYDYFFVLNATFFG
ncbi:MAG: acyltransferase, partial [Bacteroidetes bacterium]|nr:acyltransferase [Bacteroidota bacterium]